MRRRSKRESASTVGRRDTLQESTSRKLRRRLNLMTIESRYKQHTCRKVSYLKYQRHYYRRSIKKARKKKLTSKNSKKNLIKKRNSIKKQIFRRATSHACINLNNTASVREQMTADDKSYKR
jgi:hypothetical protein